MPPTLRPYTRLFSLAVLGLPLACGNSDGDAALDDGVTASSTGPGTVVPSPAEGDGQTPPGGGAGTPPAGGASSAAPIGDGPSPAAPAPDAPAGEGTSPVPGGGGTASGVGGNPDGTGGTSSGGSGVNAGGGTAGSASTGGAGTGGSVAAGGAIGMGGSVATGGSAAGGSDAVGGSAVGGSAVGGSAVGGSAVGTGGNVAAGGAAGTDDAVDDEGCPLTLEGFATLNADGQNGTYGGRDGEVVTVTRQAELNQYATAAEPYVIRVSGAIQISPKGTEIRVASDKTIVGVGADAAIVQGGFFLAEGVHNVILRNLTIRDSFVEGDEAGDTQDFDGIQMDTAHHVWIDHCHLTRMGDGLIDSRKDTTYLTVSWNILSDHNKAFGIGWTENVTAQMTIHHNWFRDLGQRNPSTDNVLRAHLYNNWLQRLDSYGNYSRGGTNMVLEHSVFEDVNDPHYYDTGSLVAIGNVYRSTSGQQEASGSSYSFFDPSDFYEYTLDPVDEVEALLERCSGPRPSLGQ